jgi:uncharacterized membrane protein
MAAENVAIDPLYSSLGGVHPHHPPYWIWTSPLNNGTNTFFGVPLRNFYSWIAICFFFFLVLRILQNSYFVSPIGRENGHERVAVKFLFDFLPIASVGANCIFLATHPHFPSAFQLMPLYLLGMPVLFATEKMFQDFSKLQVGSLAKRPPTVGSALWNKRE